MKVVLGGITAETAGVEGDDKVRSQCRYCITANSSLCPAFVLTCSTAAKV